MASCLPAFDDVIASLVLHYLEDWTPPLAELRRVLTPGGRLIASVNHPFSIYTPHRQPGRKADYFATYNWTEAWTIGGQTAQMTFWHRPLHAMTDAFTQAGFRTPSSANLNHCQLPATCFLTNSLPSRPARTSCSSSCTPTNRRDQTHRPRPAM